MDLCGGADAIIVGNSRDVVSGVRCNIRAYESVPVPLIKFDDHSRRLSLEARTDNYVPHVDTFRYGGRICRAHFPSAELQLR